MRKSFALLTFTLLVSPLLGAGLAAAAWTAPEETQAKKKQWKSNEEYNAYQAAFAEKDPGKKLSLAEAFLNKFADSDYKDFAYLLEMAAYQQLGDGAKAIDAGHKALEANPDNLDALRFVSFAFPFVFKPASKPDAEKLSLTEHISLEEATRKLEAEASAKLSHLDNDAKHGLEVLQKLQKPANVTDDQFNQAIKGLRAIFNSAVGYAAFQRKDYASAITQFKTATEDNPSDFYAFYNTGLAYLYSTPRDYDHAVWSMARAVALAKAAKDPNGEGFEKYLKQTYVGYHGNDQGLADIVAQAAGSTTPPEGFKVAPMETPKETGNPNIDNFNKISFPLKMGGERGEKTWQALKGQPLGLGGSIDSVVTGSDAGTYLVRIDILDQSKSADGVYDIELVDSTQPNVKNLSKGDLIRFQGTIDSYTATPNLVLTLKGTVIDPNPLPDQPAAKAKPKPKPRPTTTRRRPGR